jgi:chemotaxis signal transduction protein
VDSFPDIGDNVTGFILFNINNEEFAVEIIIVEATLNTDIFEEIIVAVSKQTDLTFKYNNENYHLLNLHKILNKSISNHIANKRIILINNASSRIALLVDSIKEFVTLNKKNREFLKVLPIKDNNYLIGKIEYEGKNILIPDLIKIYADKVMNRNMQISLKEEK